MCASCNPSGDGGYAASSEKQTRQRRKWGSEASAGKRGILKWPAQEKYTFVCWKLYPVAAVLGCSWIFFQAGKELNFITESSCVSMTHVPMPTRHLLKAVSLRPALLSFCVLGSSKLLQWKHMQVYKCYVATFTQKCLEPILSSSDVQTWKQGKSQLWRALKGSHVDPHFSKNCPSATMSGQSGTVCECVCV